MATTSVRTVAGALPDVTISTHPTATSSWLASMHLRRLAGETTRATAGPARPASARDATSSASASTDIPSPAAITATNGYTTRMPPLTARRAITIPASPGPPVAVWRDATSPGGSHATGPVADAGSTTRPPRLRCDRALCPARTTSAVGRDQSATP